MKFYNEYQVNSLHKHINWNLCKYCSLKGLQVWQKEIFCNFDSRVSVTLFRKTIKTKYTFKKGYGKKMFKSRLL